MVFAKQRIVAYGIITYAKRNKIKVFKCLIFRFKLYIIEFGDKLLYLLALVFTIRRFRKITIQKVNEIFYRLILGNKLFTLSSVH